MNTMIHLCWVFQHAFFRRCLLVCCTRVAVCAILRVDMKHNTPQLQYSLAPISRRCFRRPPKRKPTLNSSCLKNLTLTEGDFLADVSKLLLYRLPHQRHCAGARRVHRLRFGALRLFERKPAESLAGTNTPFGLRSLAQRSRKRFCSTYR